MRVVDIKRITHTGGKVFGRVTVPPCEKATRQDAQPECNLIAPRAMGRRTMAHLRVGRVTQEGPPWLSPMQRLGGAGEMAPRGHEATDVQTPVRVEVLQDPVRAGHGRELLPDVGQRRREVLTGTSRAKMPQDLPRRDHQGGDQAPHPVAAVRLLPCRRLARWGHLRRILPRENLPAGFFVHTDHQAALLREAQGILIAGAAVASLGVKRRSMALQPGDTSMGCEVGRVEHAPEGRAAHSLAPGMVAADRRHVIHAPSGRGVMVVCGGTRRQRQDIKALCGGKALWPAGPWRILESYEPLGEIPGAPQARGMAITGHLGGEAESGGVVRGRGPQEQPTTERQGLGSGMGAGEGFSLSPFLLCQGDGRRRGNWHRRNPCLVSGKIDMCSV
jgi:hypothetical protein